MTLVNFYLKPSFIDLLLRGARSLSRR